MACHDPSPSQLQVILLISFISIRRNAKKYYDKKGDDDQEPDDPEPKQKKDKKDKDKRKDKKSKKDRKNK